MKRKQRYFEFGRDEIPAEVYSEGGIVVGVRGPLVVMITFEPGGKVASEVGVAPDLADAIAESLIEHARRAREST